jgi:preprotein translocase subunit SecE
MVTKADHHKRNDLLFGGVSILLLIIGIGGNYYFAAQSVLLRLVVLLVMAAVVIFLLYKTAMGQKAWGYWQEVLIEVKKVVWPTKKETIQSTVGVLAMVFIMGIFLWSIDAVLVRIVAWLLRHNGA